ncbi:MAG: NAD(P)-dependent oxidoreductase [Steroidobacteraceae bacterium]
MQVGFVGLGNMGEGMAWNLASKGFAPVVRDVRPEPVARLVADGALAASSNAELGAASELVCLALFDEQQIDDTVFPCGADGGLLSGMQPGGVIAIHSTVAPSAVKRIADAADARGVKVLDAPMTGGANVAARAGTLTFMVGGDSAVLERIRPVLAAMATSIFHVGPLGAGCAVKIINNYLAVSHTLIVREAIRLGRAAGIGEEELLHMLNTGAVGSNWATQHWQRIKSQEASYTTGPAGMVAMAAKDIGLAERMAREAAVATPSLDALLREGMPDMVRLGMTDNGL